MTTIQIGDLRVTRTDSGVVIELTKLRLEPDNEYVRVAHSLALTREDLDSLRVMLDRLEETDEQRLQQEPSRSLGVVEACRELLRTVRLNNMALARVELEVEPELFVALLRVGHIASLGPHTKIDEGRGIIRVGGDIEISVMREERNGRRIRGDAPSTARGHDRRCVLPNSHTGECSWPGRAEADHEDRVRRLAGIIRETIKI